MDQYETRLLQAALDRDAGNQTQTAAELGITRQGLIKKLNADSSDCVASSFSRPWPVVDYAGRML